MRCEEEVDGGGRRSRSRSRSSGSSRERAIYRWPGRRPPRAAATPHRAGPKRAQLISESRVIKVRLSCPRQCVWRASGQCPAGAPFERRGSTAHGGVWGVRPCDSLKVNLMSHTAHDGVGVRAAPARAAPSRRRPSGRRRWRRSRGRARPGRIAAARAAPALPASGGSVYTAIKPVAESCSLNSRSSDLPRHPLGPTARGNQQAG